MTEHEEEDGVPVCVHGGIDGCVLPGVCICECVGAFIPGDVMLFEQTVLR